MDEQVRWVTEAEAAREMEISLTTSTGGSEVERSRWSGRGAGSMCVCTG